MHSRRLIILVLLGCTACASRVTQVPPTAAYQPAGAPPTPLSTSVGTPTPVAPAASPTNTPRAPRLFTETFDGPAPYWTFRQAGNSQPAYAAEFRDGFLVFDIAVPNQWAYALYGGPDYADVTVEAVVQSRTGGDGAAGVLCRYGEHTGWYELDVYADGTYQLLFGQWLGPGVANYVPLYRGQAESMRGDENTLGLDCRGEMLTPLINGQPQRKWQELKFGLARGGIGLSVSSFVDVPLTAAIDSVKVSEP